MPTFESNFWIRHSDCSRLAKNSKNGNGVTIFRHDIIVKFFDAVLFLLSSLVTGPSFRSISSLFLKIWQSYFIRDWPEIRKSEIPLSGFFSISGDGGKLRIPNLARMSLIEYYWMQQHARVCRFCCFWVIKGKTSGEWGVGKITPTPPRLGLKRHEEIWSKNVASRYDVRILLKYIF